MSPAATVLDQSDQTQQLNVRLNATLVELAKLLAAERGVALNAFISDLIREAALPEVDSLRAQVKQDIAKTKHDMQEKLSGKEALLANLERLQSEAS